MVEVQRQTLTVEEAGRVIGVSRATAYGLVHKGLLPCLKLGPHKFVVPVAALQKYLENVGVCGAGV